MEIPGLSAKASLLLASSWAAARIAVIVITPFFLNYKCDNDLLLFLQIIFYSTIASVALQMFYWAYKLYCKKKDKEPAKSMQVIYFIFDYIFYGAFRFVIFVLGIVWIIESKHCDDMILYYCIALCVAYFGVCWTICWVGCVSMFVVCWDAQTL